MKLKHLSFAASLAGLALMVASPKAQALSWNFNYSLPLDGEPNFFPISGSGTLSYTGSGDGTFDITSLSFQENGVNGTYTLDNSSYYYQQGINFSSLGKNQIQVLNGAVSNWNFYGTNSQHTGDYYGRQLFNNFETIVAASYVSGNSNFLTDVYYSSDPASTQFTSASTPVPFDFSSSQGVVLGLPLFIGLRMLKKRRALKNSICIENLTSRVGNAHHN